MACYLLVT
uniref:Uncharacterized protein n=1 Tax=Rhizophora mucronata TaxID=61149 RepID=A0A2P2PTA3_RHIMU